MRLDYQLTLADLKAGLAVHQPWRIVSGIIGLVACLELLGLGGILHLAKAPPEAGADVRRWSSVSLWLGAAFLALLFAQELRLQRILRRRAAAEERKAVTVAEHGLEAESRAATSRLEWARFCAFRESPHHFLLYYTRDKYFLFPKRAFTTANDVEAFRALLHQKIARS